MAHDDLNFTTGDVHGYALQAHTIHGDVHLHRYAPKPRHMYDPPRTWHEAEPPPPEIRSLLWAQIQAAHESPYRLPGAHRPSLDTVYVRQDLAGAVEESEQPEHPGPVLDDDGRLIETPAPPVVRLTVRPPSRTMREALDGDAHLVVAGGPGLGKSTLTLHLAADIAQHWTQRQEDPLSEPVVPLRLTARALAARLDVPFALALADSAVTEYGSFLSQPVDQELFTDRAVGCRWLLLVDGLDEVADASQRHRLLNALAAWASAGTFRILLTTRPTEGGALAPLHRIRAVRYELQPFDAAALRRFAVNWFTEDAAHRFLRQIRDAHLDELVRVPLLATIAAIIFGEYRAQPLPDNLYSLYETYLAHILRDEPDRFDRVPLLEHLARTRLETDTSLLDAARAWVTARGTPDSPSLREELTAYLVAVGPFVVRGDDLAFLHHSFAEHLAATSMARELSDSFCPNDFADVLHAADPREAGRFARAVLLHHARLHPGEADRLLDWLHHGDADQHLLAARLLARHLPASAAKIEAFLTTVHGWAMTTQFVGAEILSRTTRATHFPGLVTWLIGLMDRVDAPWRTRAEAASALAVRVRGPHTPAAIGFLHDVVDEPAALVADRLIAAEALAQCGTDEREAAERGLRAVLADRNATGQSIRVAAVVLAAFGGEARTFATDELTAYVSDVDVPPHIVAAAANGLLEIDQAFADLCADAFRAVLRSPAKTALGWHDAALGLASISPAHLDETVAHLTAHIGDRRRSAHHRVTAARTLCELGPRHRHAAGELILAAATGAVRSIDRSVLLGHLATYRTHREAALTLLRAMLAEPHQNWNNIRRAAAALAGIGPAFRAEAAASLLSAGAPYGSHDHVTVLDELVNLGEPHRTDAVRVLHYLLADPDVLPEIKARAANRLIRCGPDHHQPVIERLRALAASHHDPEAAQYSYQELVRTGVGETALVALRNLCASPDVTGDVMMALGMAVAVGASRQVEESAAVLLANARDPRRPMRIRLTAANALSILGGRFHHASAVELRAMIESGDPMLTDFLYVVIYHADSGPEPRRLLAEALLAVLADHRTTAWRAWRAVQALEELGHGDHPDVAAALVRLMSFPGLARDDRAEAALLLATRRREHLDDAAALLTTAASSFGSDVLRKYIDDLRESSVDVNGNFLAQIASTDGPVAERITAAEMVRDAAELRRLGHDERLTFTSRQRAFQGLVAVDPLALPEAKTFLHATIDDVDAPVDERSRAAWLLTQLDRSTTTWSITTLWRYTENPDVPPDERARALRWLHMLLRPPTPRYEQAAAAVLGHPDVTREAWRLLIGTLPSRLRTDLELKLLHDRTIPIEDRVPSADHWDDLPLRDEAVAEIRDVIAAPETSPRQRAEAAVALCGVSFVFHDEAVESLERLRENDLFAARAALSAMSPAQWWQVHDEALAEVQDTGLPFRLRYNAARLLEEIDADLTASTLEVLCAAPSWKQRLDGLLAAKDLDAVRRTRDNVNEPAAARVQAACKLSPYTAEDRVAAVRVIEEVAVNGRIRPALRLRAVRNLGDLGVVGRERAALAARAMMADGRLPVLTRAGAAAIVADVQRSARREALTVLSGLSRPASHLVRVRVLALIGEIDPARALPELHAMGASEPDPVVRMWCARALVNVRRDQREKAAVIARAVAWDETVPRHVRRRAAGDLARWSELMREDARALLSRLRDCAAR